MFRNSENTKKFKYNSYTPQDNFEINPGNNNPQKK